MLGEAQALAADLLPDASSLGQRVEDLVRALPEVVRGEGAQLAEISRPRPSASAWPA